MVGDRKDYDELAWQDVARQTAKHYQSKLATLATENAALREKLAERDAKIERLQGKNRTEIKAAFCEGFEAARQGYITDAWEFSKTRSRIDALTGGDNAEG